MPMKSYAPDRNRAKIEALITVIPYLILLAITVKTLAIHPLLFLASSILTSLFGIRVFTIFHDCGHQSFSPDKKWERNLGRFLGVLCFTPYEAWTRNHSIHHRSLNNLDKKLPGELLTLTVKNYFELSPVRKIIYRIFRHPSFMLGLGGILHFVFVMRVPQLFHPSSRKSVMTTNLSLAAFVAGGCLLFGTIPFLVAQGLILYFMATMGTILFYVQHQFEDSHFAPDTEWEFSRASIEGSSYFRFPQPLQWFSNNIGHHHLHHLKPKIPAYCLPVALDNLNLPGKILGLKDMPGCFNLNLYCEEKRKLISFREAYSDRMASETSTDDAFIAGKIAAKKMSTPLTPASINIPQGSKWNPMNQPSDMVMPEVMSLMESGTEAR